MRLAQPRSADGAGTRVEPSALEVDFMEGSESKAEPSTLNLNIADGSMSIG